MPLRDAAERFGFTYGTVRNLCSEFRKNPDMAFFLPDTQRKEKPAPETGRRAADHVRTRELRKLQNLSVADIRAKLRTAGLVASDSTAGCTLREAGFGKLHRPTLREHLDRVAIHRAATADCRSRDLSLRHFTNDFGGHFLFAHDLARMDLDGVPVSVMIPAGCAMRTLLALKLRATRRNSHAMADVLDPGLALFARLGAIPKRSTLTEYSCRVHLDKIRRMKKDWHGAARSLGVAL